MDDVLTFVGVLALGAWLGAKLRDMEYQAVLGVAPRVVQVECRCAECQPLFNQESPPELQ